MESYDDHTAEYARRRPLQEEFTNRLTDLLRTLITDRSIPFHGFESRTKPIDSFREKMMRSTKGYLQPLDQVTDLTGVRVIVYYNDDVDAVSRLIEEEFAVDRANSMDKRRALEPQEFGYQSVHYVVSISSSRRELTEWRRFMALRAEIQVRTVLQHAWAAISHKLAYKREADIPSGLRRKLFRLSALLELGDEEFASLRDQTHALSKEISHQIEQGKPDIELDLVSLSEYLTTGSVMTTLVTHAEEVGFDIGDSDLDLPYEPSDLLRGLRTVGITTVGGLENVLQKSASWAEQYLGLISLKLDDSLIGIIMHESRRTKWSISTSFIVCMIVIAHFKHILSGIQLSEIDWGLRENVACIVMQAATEIDTETNAA